MKFAFAAAIALYFSACGDFSLKGNFVKGMYAGSVFEDEKLRHLAVSSARGDTADIYDLINNQNVNVNGAGKEGVTPLLWAFLARNKEGYRELLKNGANPDGESRDVFTVTGLSLAYTEDPEFFELALKYGANPDLVNKRFGIPLLMQSCEEKYIKGQMEMILNSGGDINIKGQDGTTPVMFCAEIFQFDRVLYLLRRGADYGIRNDDGESLKDVLLKNHVDPRIHPDQFEYREKSLQFIR